ncbi:MAG: AraC family transcriptional regulator [Bianqueaceae bacterium]
MNLNVIAPYIRVAMRSNLKVPFTLRQRIIFDYELILLEQGSWDLTVDGCQYRCNPSDIILLRPNQQHEIHSVGDIPISQPHIHFDMWYDEYSEQVYVSYKNRDGFTPEELRMIRPDLFQGEALSTPLLHIPDLDYFKWLFFDILDIFASKKSLYPLAYRAKFIQLLQYILKENLPDMELDEASSDVSDIRFIKEYIDNNCANAISLESLALQFQYDKYYLSKKFRATYGIPVIQYYHHVRVNAAKELLLQTHSVTKTAFLLSFPSIYAFSRFFKTMTGLSPASYMKAHDEFRPNP